jgi:hypothetical protein
MPSSTAARLGRAAITSLGLAGCDLALGLDRLGTGVDAGPDAATAPRLVGQAAQATQVDVSPLTVPLISQLRVGARLIVDVASFGCAVTGVTDDAGSAYAPVFVGPARADGIALQLQAATMTGQPTHVDITANVTMGCELSVAVLAFAGVGTTWRASSLADAGGDPVIHGVPPLPALVGPAAYVATAVYAGSASATVDLPYTLVAAPSTTSATVPMAVAVYVGAASPPPLPTFTLSVGSTAGVHVLGLQ